MTVSRRGLFGFFAGGAAAGAIVARARIAAPPEPVIEERRRLVTWPGARAFYGRTYSEAVENYPRFFEEDP